MACISKHGFAAEGVTDVSHDVVGTIADLSSECLTKHPGAVLFSGRVTFTHEIVRTRSLHSYAVFARPRIFCRRGVPFIIVPARI